MGLGVIAFLTLLILLEPRMQQSFAPSYTFVKVDEGGNDDDPVDHGGRTSRGITQREYSAWRAEKGLGPKDVWIATSDEILTIYREEYWLPECDWMPVAIDYMFFDAKVNMGPHRAIVLLQRALGVTADGRIGPATRAAIKNANVHTLIDRFADAKRSFYISLHQPRFTKGWLNRVQHVKTNALSMLENKS